MVFEDVGFRLDSNGEGILISHGIDAYVPTHLACNLSELLRKGNGTLITLKSHSWMLMTPNEGSQSDFYELFELCS